jgi:hypothetical protein
MRKIILSFILVILFSLESKAQSVVGIKALGYAVMDSTKGAILYKKSVKNKKINSNIYLQVIDIQQVSIDQLASTPHNGTQPEGLYCDEREHSRSPFFQNVWLPKCDKTSTKKI